MHSQDTFCFQSTTQIIIERTSVSSDHAEIEKPEIYNDYLQISTNMPQDLDNRDMSTTQSSIVGAEPNLNQALSDEIHAFSNNSDVVVIEISEAAVSQESSGEDHLEAERCCRFCFETEETPEIGELISPCRCSGSLRHIHEVCLKTWLAQKEANDTVGPKCEICFAFYHLEARVTLKFNPSRACDEGFPNLLHGIGLAICTVNLLWFGSKCMGLDFTKGEENSERIKIVDQVSIVVCSFLGFTFFVAMIISFKSAFFENRRKVTKIYDFDPIHQQQAQELEDAIDYDIKNRYYFDDYEDEEDGNTQENDEKDQRLECPLYEDHSQGIQPMNDTLCRLVELEMSITNYQLQPV